MKRISISNNAVVVHGVFVLWFAGLAGFPVTAQEVKSSAASPVVVSAASSAKLWKSETTGKEYRVQVEKDRFYAEWVNLPADSVKRGAYIRTECRRVGSKWIGTTRVFILCPEMPGGEIKSTNGCPLTFRFEVDSITTDRIAGRGETLRNFDCQKCEVRQTGWGDFVWVPEGKRSRVVESSKTKPANK